MRDTIINLLDTLSYILVVVLTVVGFLLGLVTGLGWAILLGLLAFVIGAFTCGVWLALSGCYHKLKHIEENTRG